MNLPKIQLQNGLFLFSISYTDTETLDHLLLVYLAIFLYQEIINGLADQHEILAFLQIWLQVSVHPKMRGFLFEDDFGLVDLE